MGLGQRGGQQCSIGAYPQNVGQNSGIYGRATPIYSACILAAAFVLYRNRLRKPLTELRRASEKISANNMSFTLTYDRKDELGELSTLIF